MAEVSGVPFNSSDPASVLRTRDQNRPQGPPTPEVDEAGDSEENGTSITEQDRAADLVERRQDRLDITQETRDQGDQEIQEEDEQAFDPANRAENERGASQVLEDLENDGGVRNAADQVERQTLGPADPGSRPVVQDDPGDDDPVRPGEIADTVRNERANEVAQDTMRDFETREQFVDERRTSTGPIEQDQNTGEETEVVQEPVSETPDQAATGSAPAAGPASQTQTQTENDQEGEPPRNPADVQTERGMNIDRLI